LLVHCDDDLEIVLFGVDPARAPRNLLFSVEAAVVDMSRHLTERLLRRTGTRARLRREIMADLPTEFGRFTVLGYHDHVTGVDHVALTMGVLARGEGVPLRIHSECLTGEAFRSLRCDCGDQLTDALRYVAESGIGVVAYLRGHEGRGIGILNKLRAYSLQDHGADTVTANTRLGLPVDARVYDAVPAILRDLGVASVAVLTNNPDKVRALETAGVLVTSRVVMSTRVTPTNISYLTTKRDALGHQLLIGDQP
jgi:3,4-dihydroxy 2-butanone 4-phosphate synthase / GTP cyclohydrolase II